MMYEVWWLYMMHWSVCLLLACFLVCWLFWYLFGWGTTLAPGLFPKAPLSPQELSLYNSGLGADPITTKSGTNRWGGGNTRYSPPVWFVQPDKEAPASRHMASAESHQGSPIALYINCVPPFHVSASSTRLTEDLGTRYSTTRGVTEYSQLQVDVAAGGVVLSRVRRVLWRTKTRVRAV
jgi:hypothetical protein